MYLVLFVVLLDLQGLIVLKSSLFSIICNLWVMGGENFCLGGPAGGDGMWGVMCTLWGGGGGASGGGRVGNYATEP